MTAPWKQANLSGTWKLQEYLREYKTALRRAKNDNNPVWMKDYTTALKYYTEEFFKLPEEDRVRFPSPTSLKAKAPANDANRRARLHRALDAVMDESEKPELRIRRPHKYVRKSNSPSAMCAVCGAPYTSPQHGVPAKDAAAMSQIEVDTIIAQIDKLGKRRANYVSKCMRAPNLGRGTSDYTKTEELLAKMKALAAQVPKSKLPAGLRRLQ